MDSSWYPWVGSMAGSVLVGLSGIVPLLVFPDTSKLQDSSTIPLGKSHTIVQYFFFYSAYHHILDSTLIVNDCYPRGKNCYKNESKPLFMKLSTDYQERKKKE